MRTTGSTGAAPIALEVCLVALGVGCVTPDMPPRTPLPDAAPVDAPLDGLPIGVIRDAPVLDTPTITDGASADGADAPTMFEGFLLDGVLSEPAWGSATMASSTLVAGVPFAGCRLQTLRAVATADALYLGVEGSVGSPCVGSGLVVFVELSPGDGAGMILNGGSPDIFGALDAVISTPLQSVEPLFRPDAAWGTTLASFGVSAATDELGWRRVSATPFTWPFEDATACSADACETRVAWSALAAASGAREITLSARLGNGTSWADPTIPQDAVSSILELVMHLPVNIP